MYITLESYAETSFCKMPNENLLYLFWLGHI